MWSVVRTCLLRLVPLPRSSADSRDEDGPLAGRGHRSVDVGQEARFALAELKSGGASFGAVGSVVGHAAWPPAGLALASLLAAPRDGADRSPVRVISQVAMYAVWS